MKRILTLTVIWITTISIQAQDYIPFPDSLATWNSYRFEAYSSYQIYDAANFHLAGDTLINDTIYSKLYVRKSWFLGNPSGLDTNYSHIDHPYVFIGGIREDDTKKVWYRNVNFDNWGNESEPFPWYWGKFYNPSISEFLEENVELMLYDFNIEIGDSVYFYDGYCTTYWEVLDTIIVDEVLDRRKYIFYNNDFLWSDITWVEGIGDIRNDPFSRLDVATCIGLGFDIGKGLGCFWENGNQIYSNGNQIGTSNEFDFPVDCDGAIFVGIEEFETQSLEIYPNPSSGEFRVMLPEYDVSDVMVYDIAGKVVFNETDVRVSNFILDMSSFEDGIYFINVQSVGGGRYFSKIVKR